VSARKGQHSFEDAIEYIGFGAFQWKLSMLLLWMWMADAMEVMLMSFLLTEVQRDWNLSRMETATVGAVTFFGMLVGNWSWGLFADMYGRRRAILCSTTISSTMGIISASATGPMSLSIMRGLVGFGIGGASVSFSLFTEYLPRRNRGMALVLMQGMAWTAGSMLQALLAWAIVPTAGWRWMLVISAIPLGGLVVAFIFFLPESARWYLVAGKAGEAQYFIREVGIMNRRPIGGEFKLAEIEEEPRGQMKQLFGKKLFKSTMLLWAIWFSNLFLYYGIVVFVHYYFRSQNSNIYLVAFVTSIAEIPGQLLTIFLLDRKGRKTTLAILFLACGANVMYLSGIVTVPTSILAIFAFCARGFVFGTISASFVYTSELYPTSCRSTGVGTASAVGRVAAILTIYLSVATFHPSTYIVPILVFTTVCIVAAVASMHLPIETI